MCFSKNDAKIVSDLMASYKEEVDIREKILNIEENKQNLLDLAYAKGQYSALRELMVQIELAQLEEELGVSSLLIDELDEAA